MNTYKGKPRFRQEIKARILQEEIIPAYYERIMNTIEQELIRNNPGAEGDVREFMIKYKDANADLMNEIFNNVRTQDNLAQFAGELQKRIDEEKKKKKEQEEKKQEEEKKKEQEEKKEEKKEEQKKDDEEEKKKDDEKEDKENKKERNQRRNLFETMLLEMMRNILAFWQRSVSQDKTFLLKGWHSRVPDFLEQFEIKMIQRINDFLFQHIVELDLSPDIQVQNLNVFLYFMQQDLCKKDEYENPDGKCVPFNDAKPSSCEPDETWSYHKNACVKHENIDFLDKRTQLKYEAYKHRSEQSDETSVLPVWFLPTIKESIQYFYKTGVFMDSHVDYFVGIFLPSKEQILIQQHNYMLLMQICMLPFIRNWSALFSNVWFAMTDYQTLLMIVRQLSSISRKDIESDPILRKCLYVPSQDTKQEEPVNVEDIDNTKILEKQVTALVAYSSQFEQNQQIRRLLDEYYKHQKEKKDVKKDSQPPAQPPKSRRGFLVSMLLMLLAILTVGGLFMSSTTFENTNFTQAIAERFMPSSLVDNAMNIPLTSVADLPTSGEQQNMMNTIKGTKSWFKRYEAHKVRNSKFWLHRYAFFTSPNQEQFVNPDMLPLYTSIPAGNEHEYHEVIVPSGSTVHSYQTNNLTQQFYISNSNVMYLTDATPDQVQRTFVLQGPIYDTIEARMGDLLVQTDIRNFHTNSFTQAISGENYIHQLQQQSQTRYRTYTEPQIKASSYPVLQAKAYKNTIEDPVRLGNFLASALNQSEPIEEVARHLFENTTQFTPTQMLLYVEDTVNNIMTDAKAWSMTDGYVYAYKIKQTDLVTVATLDLRQVPQGMPVEIVEIPPFSRISIMKSTVVYQTVPIKSETSKMIKQQDSGDYIAIREIKLQSVGNDVRDTINAEYERMLHVRTQQSQQAYTYRNLFFQMNISYLPDEFKNYANQLEAITKDAASLVVNVGQQATTYVGHQYTQAQTFIISSASNTYESAQVKMNEAGSLMVQAKTKAGDIVTHTLQDVVSNVGNQTVAFLKQVESMVQNPQLIRTNYVYPALETIDPIFVASAQATDNLITSSLQTYSETISTSYNKIQSLLTQEVPNKLIEEELTRLLTNEQTIQSNAAKQIQLYTDLDIQTFLHDSCRLGDQEKQVAIQKVLKDSDMQVAKIRTFVKHLVMYEQAQTYVFEMCKLMDDVSVQLMFCNGQLLNQSEDLYHTNRGLPIHEQQATDQALKDAYLKFEKDVWMTKQLNRMFNKVQNVMNSSSTHNAVTVYFQPEFKAQMAKPQPVKDIQEIAKLLQSEIALMDKGLMSQVNLKYIYYDGSAPQEDIKQAVQQFVDQVQFEINDVYNATCMLTDMNQIIEESLKDGTCTLDQAFRKVDEVKHAPMVSSINTTYTYEGLQTWWKEGLQQQLQTLSTYVSTKGANVYDASVHAMYGSYRNLLSTYDKYEPTIISALNTTNHSFKELQTYVGSRLQTLKELSQDSLTPSQLAKYASYPVHVLKMVQNSDMVLTLVKAMLGYASQTNSLYVWMGSLVPVLYHWRAICEYILTTRVMKKVLKRAKKDNVQLEPTFREQIDIHLGTQEDE